MIQDCEVRSVRCSRGMSCQELRSMLPTVIILLFTVIIIFTVIPYAFISVMKQMEAAQALEIAKSVRDNSNVSLAHNNQTDQI